MRRRLGHSTTLRQTTSLRSFSVLVEPGPPPIHAATRAGDGRRLRTIEALFAALAVAALAGCTAAGPSTLATYPASSSLEPSRSSTETAPAPASGQPVATSTPDDMPTAPSTPTPTLPPGLVLAKADLSIKCGSTDLGNFPMVYGDTIYVDCPDYGEHGAILVVDATTGRVAKTLNLSRLADLQAVDHGVWVDWSRACVAGSSCPAYLERLDPETGRVTLHLDDHLIAAAGLGYVWTGASPGSMTRIDTTTLAMTTIPFPYTPVVACGSLLGYDGDGYHRLDPTTGARLADVADSKGVSVPTDVNGQCWGIVTDNAQRRAQFVRMGQTAIDYRGPWISGSRYAPDLRIMGNAFWLTESASADYELYRLQQIDPATGKLLGTAWAVPGFLTEVVAAGGRIWRMDDGYTYTLQRLNISSEPLATPPAR